MFEFDDGESQRQVLCERCRKFVMMSDIKYVAKGNDSKMALCTKCLKNFSAPPVPARKGFGEEQVISKYFCERCAYNFKVKGGSNAALRCPYCGKSDKIQESKIKSAEHLIRESADF